MTAVTDFPRWYNSVPRGETPLGTVDVRDLPPEDYKYADVDYVYPRTNGLVKHIIETAPLTTGGLYKRVLIDIKVQDLHPEICSCLPGWHLDGSMQEIERHHLCVLNGPQTEFVDEPLFLDRRHLIPDDVKITTAREGFITTFTTLDFTPHGMAMMRTGPLVRLAMPMADYAWATGAPGPVSGLLRLEVDVEARTLVQRPTLEGAYTGYPELWNERALHIDEHVYHFGMGQLTGWRWQ